MAASVPQTRIRDSGTTTKYVKWHQSVNLSVYRILFADILQVLLSWLVLSSLKEDWPQSTEFQDGALPLSSLEKGLLENDQSLEALEILESMEEQGETDHDSRH